MEQRTFDFTSRPIPFGGQTFEAEQDGKRLTSHLQKVFDLMKDNRWRTLRQISDAVGCTEASASARLRDLRKSWAGGHIVDRRRVAGGQYEYRVEVNAQT